MNYLYFWHENCSPCMGNKQYVEQLKSNPNFKSINTTENPELANQYQIRTVPTLIIKDKQGIDYKYAPKQIKEILQTLCSK